MTKKKNIFVGLSGGVDSAVAAALLKKAGHEVTGVFMKNWSAPIAGNICPWREDLASARRVAARLTIPFKIYDFEKQYRRTVANYMIKTYRLGLTPNPDIMCNEEIKFKTFLEKCLGAGADAIATGHYARLEDRLLKKAKDHVKDQSYFLYRMSLHAAAKTLFPIGELTKLELRQLARKFGLPNAERPDSQGLCFVGNVSMRDFLHEFIDYKPGDIIDEAGQKIGSHDGAFFYTIGQRHGLGLGGGRPYFIYKIDGPKNIIYVTNEEKSDLLNKKQFSIAGCVWRQKPAASKTYQVLVRYRATTKPARLIKKTGGRYDVKLLAAERAIAPGQSAVFYDGDVVLGGGIII